MTLGGNRNMNALLSEYGLLEASLETKYRSVAVNYYVQLLTA